MMIEGFNIRKVYLGQSAVLALFSAGRSTGTVIDSGAGSTHIVPVLEGYGVAHAVREVHASGNAVTHLLHKSLMERSDVAFKLGTNKTATMSMCE